MLLEKGIYPYEYMDSWEKFNETPLPDIEEFYSNPNMEDIADADYKYAKKNLNKKSRWISWFICSKWYTITCR